ncbi:hypothetical protein [Mycobacterium leprae]|uniref:hypothetical protein n=1 Tax=Mycobacterium leprae TaxID=1769 RepID=UPI001E2B9F60|nr:hypothetical protein [Mycobacterium leprae]
MDAARTHAENRIGLVTGTPTNLAVLLYTESARPTLLSRLVIIGGVFDGSGQSKVAAEWNNQVG